MAFTGQRTWHRVSEGFETTNGTIATAYTTLVSDAVNNAGATWTIDNSGDDVRIRVTGNIGRTIHWQFKIEISMN